MMNTVATHNLLHHAKRATVRMLVIGALSTVMASTWLVIQEPTSVYAAPSASTTVRHDRRPDRERPVNTSQGSSSGYVQGSSSARPRLVRR